jgi:hypothetical protein
MTTPRPIAIFFHGLFVVGDPPKSLPNAARVIHRLVVQMADSGLMDAAQEIHVGINGGKESEGMVANYIPKKATVTYHGLQCRNENLTLVMLENWVKVHPGWNVLYFHAKNASHDPNSDYGRFGEGWREGMAADLITNWRQCVTDLDTGFDIVCSHWMWNCADGTQHIPAGNFLWVTSDFAAKLPSIYLRQRIKDDGIGALSSRFEAEVLWGNGPRPVVKSFRPNGGSGVP